MKRGFLILFALCFVLTGMMATRPDAAAGGDLTSVIKAAGPVDPTLDERTCQGGECVAGDIDHTQLYCDQVTLSCRDGAHCECLCERDDNNNWSASHHCVADQ